MPKKGRQRAQKRKRCYYFGGLDELALLLPAINDAGLLFPRWAVLTPGSARPFVADLARKALVEVIGTKGVQLQSAEQRETAV